MEQQFSGEPEAQPELLAHHCAQAGLAARAVENWSKAGQQAIARSAVKEAVAHLTAGLDLLHGLPESQALELDLQLAPGGALAAVQGHGMPGTAQAYERAVDLSRACGRKDMLYPALDGLMTSHFSRGDLANAVRLGRDFLALTREDGRIAAQIIANMDWFEAELHRLRGEALLALSPEQAAEAEASYHQALAVARDQGARLWELRAATSLARLWRDQGKRQQAHNLLAPVYDGFTEGFDTGDLKKAKELLNELALRNVGSWLELLKKACCGLA
jgi:hypothetical protein